MSKHNVKMRSSISDEELAKVIEGDKMRNPSDFSCGPIVSVDSPNIKSVSNPSRTFESFRKWL